MKTLADAKRRLTVGTAVVLDKYEVRGVPAPHKYLNVPRYVVVAQTNSFALGPTPDTPRAEASWADWPKAAEFRADEDGEGFTVSRGGDHIVSHYRIVS